MSLFQLFETLRTPSIYTMQKLWISIPTNGEALNEAEQTSILHKLANLEVENDYSEEMNNFSHLDYFFATSIQGPAPVPRLFPASSEEQLR